MSMDWQQEYKRKLVKPEEAVKVVKSGDLVSIPIGTDPRTLKVALLGRAHELKGVRIRTHNDSDNFPWHKPEFRESFVTDTWFIVHPEARKIIVENKNDIYVGGASFSTKGYDEGRTDCKRPDVVLVEVSPPDQNGYCSFGHWLWDKKEQCQSAKIILGEVNPRFIRTFGENYIHLSQIGYLVEQAVEPVPTRPPLEEMQEKDVSAQKAIAGYTSSLIRNGDTILVGAGRISEVLPNFGLFDNKHDLGWHAERWPRGFVKTYMDNPETFSGKYKTIHRGKATFAAITLLPGEAEYCHLNPNIELYSVHYINHVATLARLDNLVSIINILAIDFTGQVTCESIGPAPFSGPGGSTEISVGTMMAKGGRLIYVMPSTVTVKGNKLSRIMPVLEPGTVVTVPRIFADYVITEYGIARLWSRTAKQRAEELIAVSHPDFRSELKKEANRLLGL